MRTMCDFYFLEQNFDNGTMSEPCILAPIINICYNNTASVIARLVKNGRMNFFLSQDPLAEDFMKLEEAGGFVNEYKFTENGEKMSITRYQGDYKKLAEYRGKLLQLVTRSRLIPPEEIISVFRDIDARYNKAD